ncbi:MAG: Phosphatidylinositol alpha-1,6-mannosyltransferase [Candidatus Magasanikbacteria bacterium GW2011_GWA2_37_8]|uniref:Phosphatidylinositol alpha-1,6-mannosyltransferase n=1 Tax=Candidatus Magasanikbacteria bacterium GW2011_GWA2_37_8 TaxID=1619036 RepID=A0A0G0JWD9_9BACT|nr:MAG: Phosphatidylinositol alpha-1,6-mannosyltransferase [Candidatus Magasanikbacteria bacterium GW2011_GWA2_37_8]
MQKTLLITLEYPPIVGGIASYTYNLAKHLPAERVVVYAPKVLGGSEFDQINPWKTYRYKPYWSFLWPQWLRLFWQVRKIVKQEKIEQIYVNHVLPVGYVAYLIKKFWRVPYTLFLHGTDINLATATSGKRKKFIRLCRSAFLVVANSQFMKDKLSSLVENLPNIQVVYPCPGDEFFNPPVPAEIEHLRSQLALNGKKVILTVARLAEGKGYPHLIRLLPQILNKVPNLVWLIIGDGSKKKVIMEMVQKNNLQNVVRWLGQMPYNELPKYYHLADLFVLLTHKDETAEEGWGTVFLEAGATGLPVVAGRVGGVEEVVENLKNGLLVDIYQDMSVVSAVADLLREKEYALTMGETGRARATDEFRWEKQVKKLV